MKKKKVCVLIQTVTRKQLRSLACGVRRVSISYEGERERQTPCCKVKDFLASDAPTTDGSTRRRRKEKYIARERKGSQTPFSSGSTVECAMKTTKTLAHAWEHTGTPQCCQATPARKRRFRFASHFIFRSYTACTNSSKVRIFLGFQKRVPLDVRLFTWQLDC